MLHSGPLEPSTAADMRTPKAHTTTRACSLWWVLATRSRLLSNSIASQSKTES
uniref:Uncharacterized protein n=1 Tax=Heterorhabditis bacteriophora TaxID=37862 RepID=A0A1I7W916_HETBA